MPALKRSRGLADVARYVRDLRASARSVYTYYQHIAPIHDGVLPGPEAFCRVACQDISTGGVSFIAEDEPDFDALVVALGPPGRVLYVAAEVVSVNPIVAVNGDFFRVGCRFTERVEL